MDTRPKPAPEPESEPDPGPEFEPPLPRRQAPHRGWRPSRPVAIGAIVALAAAGTGLGIAVTAGGSGAGGSGTVNVTGTLTLSATLDGLAAGSVNFLDTSVNSDNPTAGDACAGAGGYSDITSGAQVVIGDGSVNTLAVGQLQEGSVGSVSSNLAMSCQFAFSVPAPSGHAFYTVTISHRGALTFTAAQVAAGNLSLSLGG